MTVPPPRNRYVRLTRTLQQVYRAARKENADLYHFHDPELLVVGWLLSTLGKTVIYDVHEDVPKQILTKHWIPLWMRGVVASFVSRIEASIVRRIAGIVAATPAIARRFPTHKTVTVQNFPILGELSWDPHTSNYHSRPHNVIYAGGITKNRGASQMLEALEKVSADLQARLILAGKFIPNELAETLRGFEGWKATSYLGWVPREQLRAAFSKARLGLVLFHPMPNHVEAQPNKMFEYMSASLPVVASDFPLWREIVQDARCGLLVDPLDTKAIADAIQWLLEHPIEAEAMGRRGREAVESRYNWRLESKKLLRFYEDLLS